MNVLIVNDDGIESEGLRILSERVGKKHDVYVLAPDSNRSATSHHIQMFQDLELRKHGKRQWSCAGMPADCTCIGIRSDFFDVKFDVVLSGINCGANLGTDVIFSGTCAGARQAVLNGVPGIALSIDPVDWEKVHKEGFKYVALADFVCANLETMVSLCNTQYKGSFLNINAASCDSYKGVKITKNLLVRDYDEEIEIVKNQSAVFSHFNPKNTGKEIDLTEETDFSIVRQGFIAMSFIHAEPTAFDVVDGITFKV